MRSRECVGRSNQHGAGTTRGTLGEICFNSVTGGLKLEQCLWMGEELSIAENDTSDRSSLMDSG